MDFLLKTAAQILRNRAEQTPALRTYWLDRAQQLEAWIGRPEVSWEKAKEAMLEWEVLEV